MPQAWIVERYRPDTDMRIQALGSLIHTDADKAIPILRQIALEPDNPGAARRALFVLAQSRKPEAVSTVIEVAKAGPEPVRIAAVREIGLWGGPDASRALLQVYSSANEPVKQQVVRALSQRSERAALLDIARSERVRALRESAIVALGRAGGREQLRALYASVPAEFKRPVIVGLFNAKADEELIRIAETEKNSQLREEALARLRLLGTERARAYLETKRRR
jgi:HEAT repeat protein